MAFLPNIPSLLMIMICFWVSFFLVDRYLLKPISGILQERKKRIDGAHKEWESKNQEYLSATERLESEMQDAAREAAGIRAEFRQQAESKRQEALDHARTKASERLDKALEELAGDAAKARQDLRQQAQELAQVFAAHLLEREVVS